MYIHTYMPNIRDLVCPLIRLRLKAPTKSPSDWINPVETIYCPKEYRKQDRCCNAGSQRMWNSWLWQAKGLCVLSQRSLCVSSYLVLVSQQFFIEKETAGSRGVTPGLQNKPQNRRNSFPTEWLNTIWLLASIKTSWIGCVNNISGYKSVSQAGIRNLFSPECGLLRVLTQIFWQNACCFPHKYLYLPRMHHTHTQTHTPNTHSPGSRNPKDSEYLIVASLPAADFEHGPASLYLYLCICIFWHHTGALICRAYTNSGPLSSSSEIESTIHKNAVK